MEGMDAKALLVGGACDSHAILAHGEVPDREVLIPQKRSRKAGGHMTRHMSLKAWVRRCLLHLKRWWGMAMRIQKMLDGDTIAVVEPEYLREVRDCISCCLDGDSDSIVTTGCSDRAGCSPHRKVSNLEGAPLPHTDRKSTSLLLSGALSRRVSCHIPVIGVQGKFV